MEQLGLQSWFIIRPFLLSAVALAEAGLSGFRSTGDKQTSKGLFICNRRFEGLKRIALILLSAFLFQSSFLRW
jgi:hypothetical protein